MIAVDPAAQSARDNYKLLIGSIIPRPVAFVTTLSEDGVVNGAPFSFFNVVSSDPPMVSVSVQRKDGQPKDTARHAANRGEFVVHIADERNIEAINRTAAALPSDVSELELAGLTAVASDAVTVPGVAEARIRMECVLEHALQLGGEDDKPACDLLIGRVVRFHIAEELYSDGRIDGEKLSPVSRLAGDDYAKLGETFTLVRPR
jgi:Conserved protein/domain typically associated with flavoprotein oxygenases, DIM6/NTAB family